MSTFHVSPGAAGTVASSQGSGNASDQRTTAVSSTGTQADAGMAAVSIIRDAKLATEAANPGKARTLVQAALAQANSAPQAILSLLM